MLMLDTSVAIAARDADPGVLTKLEAIAEPILLSVISWIELESGVPREPASALRRRRGLDELQDTYTVLPFGEEDVHAYRGFIEAIGFSRRKLLDRMIAAQAMVAGARLATLNPDDFSDLPGLVVQDWSA
jgi:tRNA(fMet)-specific endonuclease VapC